jgi:3',5'-nucleoside bisphosphate phosphatase
VRIDLHTHSDRSDGTLTPREVVRAARSAALDVVALTDHDTAEGWRVAAEEALEVGVTLVPGIEISCKHAGHGLHLLAYLPDPAYPPLVQALAAILDGRDQRMPQICAALRSHGVAISEAHVEATAREAAALGRPHVADALVALGVVATREQAFEEWLSPGRPAYVNRYAPPVEDMIRLVSEAGGVTVVAHPWGRRLDHSALMLEGLAALAELGLAGVEVDHQDHSPEQRRQLRGIAGELDLVVTGSSDFHGAGKVDHDLGCHTTDPDQLDRLLARAEEAARASGRSAPALVRR